MATGGGGGGGGGTGGGAGASTGGSGASGAAASARSTSEGAPIKAGDVEVLSADGKSQGVFNDGRPAAPNIRLEALERRPNEPQGVRLESFGRGASSALVDASNEVVIKRSGKVVERFGDSQEIADFADKKKLSDKDRDTLLEMNKAARDVKAAEEIKAAQAPRQDFTNAVEDEKVKGRIRAEVERNDAEVFARVEAMKKTRQAAKARAVVEPLEPVPAPTTAAARAGQEAEARSDDTITRESPFASPNTKIRVVPAEISSQFIKAGDKYYVPNNTKVVAFVDRGDKLETPSSAPQIAKSLVAIAEARVG